MKIKLLDKNCMPFKKYEKDAGWDLKSRYMVTLNPLETKKITTGVCIEIPTGCAGDIRPRSSISERGIQIHYGTVDVGYTGEVGVIMTNISGEPVTIGAYERVAQLVINKLSEDNKLEVVDELPESDRGNNGFGSTGRV